MSNNLHEDPSDCPEVEERARVEPLDDLMLEEYKAATPRNHDLLDKKGNFLNRNLSEFEMIRILGNMRIFDLLHKTNGTPRYEVHYVDEQRELEVEEAASFLQRKKEEYKETDSISHK